MFIRQRWSESQPENGDRIARKCLITANEGQVSVFQRVSKIIKISVKEAKNHLYFNRAEIVEMLTEGR